jgi:hypothetical protein
VAALDDRTGAVIRKLEAQHKGRAEVRRPRMQSKFGAAPDCVDRGMSVISVDTKKKELQDLKVECEEFHGERNDVIRSRTEQR